MISLKQALEALLAGKCPAQDAHELQLVWKGLKDVLNDREAAALCMCRLSKAHMRFIRIHGSSRPGYRSGARRLMQIGGDKVTTFNAVANLVATQTKTPPTQDEAEKVKLIIGALDPKSKQVRATAKKVRAAKAVVASHTGVVTTQSEDATNDSGSGNSTGGAYSGTGGGHSSTLNGGGAESSRDRHVEAAWTLEPVSSVLQEQNPGMCVVNMVIDETQPLLLNAVVMKGLLMHHLLSAANGLGNERVPTLTMPEGTTVHESLCSAGLPAAPLAMVRLPPGPTMSAPHKGGDQVSHTLASMLESTVDRNNVLECAVLDVLSKRAKYGRIPIFTCSGVRQEDVLADLVCAAFVRMLPVVTWGDEPEYDGDSVAVKHLPATFGVPVSPGLHECEGAPLLWMDRNRTMCVVQPPGWIVISRERLFVVSTGAASLLSRGMDVLASLRHA